MYIVSACLVGLETRYDGSHARCESLLEEIGAECFIPLCPEQLGGLPTPRVPAFIDGGDGFQVLKGQAKVVNKEGIDVTRQFLKGAYQVLNIAKAFRVKTYFLRDGSPSCGVNFTHGREGRVPGCGVLTALLTQEKSKIVAAG
jgi:uncharacterized protein YbbK (DUF523 family)